MTYRAPVEEIAFSLKHSAGFSEMLEQGLFGDLDEEVVDAILQEAGKFATERLAPLNMAGDKEGAKMVDGKVVMPTGWTQAYGEWADGGWAGLACPAEFGGQGLPISLSMACAEMWNAASMAFSLNPLLTQGAVHALQEYGSDVLKQTYLHKMVSGEWTGSMQLTEPQSGSDLSGLKTKAVPAGDGTYRLSGTKIFITYGDHEMTDNIIHLVLARTPDAPAGTRGISLFVVPKFLVSDDGSLGARNDVYCTKLEHKLGIHGSPTCVMNLGDKEGAIGWLVGEENRGLHHMFTMMNEARLAVGVQGVGIASRAYSHAIAYAQERKQGRSVHASGGEPAPIIEHPDIRRTLMRMKSSIAAARAIAYTTATSLDKSIRSNDDKERAAAHARASLLTPVAKAYGTDIGVEVASEGIQVHGGMGYIEETGAAQHYRDARIAPIYEGTNGIQAIDLVTRKLPLGGGEAVRSLLTEMNDHVSEISATNDPRFTGIAEGLSTALLALQQATGTITDKLQDDPDAALAVATPYARLFGLAVGGALLGKSAIIAVRNADTDGRTDARLAEARFFAAHQAAEAPGLHKLVETGSASVNDLTLEQLAT